MPYKSGGLTYGIDFSSQKEGDGIDNPTYAAITARGYHPNVVNASLMDGSVRSYDGGVDSAAWQSLSMRCDGSLPGMNVASAKH